MIFRQLFDQASGTYSYLLASRRGGEDNSPSRPLSNLAALMHRSGGGGRPEHMQR